MTTKTKSKAKSPQKGPNADTLRRVVDIATEYGPASMVALLHRLQVEEGAKVTERKGQAVFSLGGLSTSSPSGDTGAMQNWLNAARRHLAQAV